MKRRDLFISICVIIIALILIIYFFQTNTQDETIKIGAILPLTGSAANFGNSSKNAMDLAVSEINKFKTQIDVIFENGEANPSLSINSFNKLYNVDKVQTFISMTSAVCMALKPISISKKVLFFANASHPDITEEGSFIFRFSNTAEDEVDKILIEINQKFENKSVSIIASNDDYGRSYVKQFKSKIENSINIVNEEYYNSNETDFKVMITKIKKDHSALVILIGYGKPIGNCLSQMKELKLNKNFIVSLGFILSNDAINVAGSAIEGGYYLNFKFTEDKSSDSFYYSYLKKYNEIPAPNAYIDYLTIRLIFLAYMSVGNDPQAMSKYLKKEKINLDSSFINIDSIGNIKVPVILSSFDSTQKPKLWRK